MLERRANPVGRAATAGIRRISLGGLRLAVLDIEQTANFMIEMVFPQRRVSRPLYLTSACATRSTEINALAPDCLWVALGVPYEQSFVEEFTPRLCNVGVIKTAGGLFNFLSGSRARAPLWMHGIGLEWAWRIWLEPRRLFWRYFTTNPRALYLLFNKGRPSRAGRRRRG